MPQVPTHRWWCKCTYLNSGVDPGYFHIVDSLQIISDIRLRHAEGRVWYHVGPLLLVPKYTTTHTHVHTYVHIVRMHMYTHACTHAHTHIHTSTQTGRRSRLQNPDVQHCTKLKQCSSTCRRLSIQLPYSCE